MVKLHNTMLKKNILKKMVGDIVYLNSEQIREFQYDQIFLEDFNSQQLEGGIISMKDDRGIKKVMFDVVSSRDFHGGYIKGFFYSDGRFLGHFYYTADANLPKETIDGNYTKIRDGYEIKGIFYKGGTLQTAFCARLMKEI